jgi:multidrug resistance efflux pump
MKLPRLPLRPAWLLGLLALAASLTGGWAFHSRAGGNPGPRPTPAPPDDSAGRGVVCFGHVDVEPGISSLYPLQTGRVDEVKVREDEEVPAGAVLLSLDRRPAEALVRQARADLDAARAQHEQAQAAVAQQRIKEAEQQAAIDTARQRLKAAGTMLARKEELVGIQVNEKEVQAGREGLGALKAALRGEEQKLEELRLNDPRLAVRRAAADVTAKEARLDQALLALAECDLKAPAAGKVLRLFAHTGDVLGAQPKEPAALFCPRGPRIVRAEVEQEFAGRVAVGQDAVVQDDSSAPGTWTGKVTRLSDWYTHRRSILQEPLQLNDVRTLECLIALDPGQPPLRIGQRVRVTIGPREK